MPHGKAWQHRYSPRLAFAYFPILPNRRGLGQLSIRAKAPSTELETNMSYISHQQRANIESSIWQPILSAWLAMPADESAPVRLTDIVPVGFPTAEAMHGLPGGWVWRRV